MSEGIVSELWRYPVKSFQGLTAEALEVTAGGVSGDRAWGLVDPETGHLLSAKRIAALLLATADDEAITLPDGGRLSLTAPDPDLDDRLSAWLGRPVHLAGDAEAGERSFEMTFDPPNDDAEYYEIPAP